MKKTFVIISLLLISKLFSQQDAQYTMYMFNMMSINPAYAGASELTDFTLLARKQWLGFDGSPQTVSFNFNHPFNYNKMGIGASIINDKIGLMQYNHINLAYAYRVNFKKSALSFGIQPSFTQISVGANNVLLDNPNSPQVYDNAFNTIRQFELKTGAGIYWQNKNTYLGISSPHFAKLTPNKSLIKEESLYDSKQHFFIAAGHVINLKGAYKLKPSFMLKYTNGAPVSADINCNFYFNQYFGIGLSYRNFDSMDAIIEYRLKNNLKFGYAFDYTLTALRKHNSGSHEILVNWQFGQKKGKIITPRYF